MENQKSSQFSANVLYNLIYQVSLYIAPLITTPYVSRVLGSALIGRYSFAQSIVSYFVLAAGLGTTMYGQRKIASLKGNDQEQTAVFWEIVALRAVMTLLAGAVYITAVIPGSANRELYWIVGLEIIQVIVDISWFYQGKEVFQVIALCNGGSRLLAVAATLLFVKSHRDFNLYVLISGGVILMGFLSQWLSLPRYLMAGVAGIRGSQVLSHFTGAIKLFVAQAAIQVYTVLDKTMIGVISGSEAQNGYYEQAQKVVRVLVAVSTVISAVVASRMAVLWSRKEKDRMQELLDLSFRYVCCVSIPIVFGLNLIADWFVPVYYGDDFRGVVPLLRVLSVLPLVIGISNVTGIQYLVPTGQENSLTKSVLVGSLVNAGLNFFLIQGWAAVGAAVASVIAEICVTAVQVFVVRRQVRLRKLPGLVLRYMLLSVPMYLVGRGVMHLTSGGLLGTVLVVVCCIGFYLLEILLIKDPILKLLGKRK